MIRAVVEIRTYRLKPGTVEEFDHVVSTRSVPLLRTFGIEVVRFGPSELHEDENRDDYLLIRAFESVTDRTEKEDRFYGSDEWLSDLRHEIVSRIDHYHTIILTVDPEALPLLASEPTT